VLVTGAGGFVGGHLCAELASLGMLVRAVTRDAASLRSGSPRVEPYRVDNIGPATAWRDALQGVDSVVHLAARTHVLDARAASLDAFREVNVEGTRALAEACVAAGVARLVFVSSIKAVGECTSGDASYTEDSLCSPADAYGRSKLEAEGALRQAVAGSTTSPVILRPPLVYGPGVGANFLRLIKLVDRGLPFPLGRERNERSLLYVRNLTSAIVCCLRHPLAGDRLYHVADVETHSTLELARELGEMMGRPVRIIPLPGAILNLAGKVTGRSEDVRRLISPLRVSTERIRRELGWTPPFTWEEGLRATAAWYRDSGRSAHR
jgi:nucleoside-diphosphate-sugar epimerase